MIAYALEKYPIKTELPDGSICEIRPLVSTDEAAFHGFYQEVPQQERLFIKHRITDRAIFHEWCTDIDYENNLPMLVFADDQLVADGTLHQRAGGWKRHLGLVSILVHPRYASRGLVRMLIKELVDIGRHAGLTHLEAEFLGGQKRAIRAFEEANFEILASIPKYVRDAENQAHDYVLMGLRLTPKMEYVGAGD